MSFLNNVFGAGANSAMGLSLGEAARNAATSTLEEERYNVLAQQYQNQLAQSMLQTKQAVAQSVYQQAMKPFNPNDNEAYKLSLSNLVTLWQAKYGDEWVETFTEDFWRDACDRLTEAGKMEVAKRTWARIKEDA